MAATALADPSPLDLNRVQPSTAEHRGAVFLGALLGGAGLIHVAMAPAHLGSSIADGAGFLAAGAAQLMLAVVVVARPRRWAAGLAAAVSAVTLGAWVLSRTVGLPYGAHEGTAEPVAFVDGVTAALEVVALGAAAALIIRLTTRRTEPIDLVGSLVYRVLSIGAVAIALAAIASPSAREHGGAGHGHGEAASGHSHGGATATGDDLGYSELANGQMAGHEHPEGPVAEIELSVPETRALSAQLAATAPLVERYPTIADAEAAGYRQQGPFSPGLGVHYSGPGMSLNPDGVMDVEDIEGAMLIYDGIEDDSRLAGFMYMAYQEDAPEGFAGDLDQWHFHTATCIVSTPDGIDTPFGADLTGVTEEMCAAKGGALIDFTGYMVHVWTVPGYESPEGVFSDLNPKITCPDGTYYTIETAEIGDADSTCLAA